jgi:hypothetical protein
MSTANLEELLEPAGEILLLRSWPAVRGKTPVGAVSWSRRGKVE